MIILGQLRDTNSTFRKDYESYVESTGEKCPLLESIKLGDSYWEKKRLEMSDRYDPEFDFGDDS